MKNILKNKRVDRLIPPAQETNGVKPRDRVMLVVAYLTIALTAILLAVLLWWIVLEPDKVFGVKDNKITPINKTVQAGEEVNLQLSFCKYIDTPGEVTRTFVSDKTVIYTPPTREELGKVCLDNIIADVAVPDQAPPGEYRVKFDAKYKINPLKDVHETYVSQPFTVTARQGTGEGQVNQ